MATLTAGLPGVRIYVVSIPDVYRLWEVYRTSVTARLVLELCRDLPVATREPLVVLVSDVARRARVRQRTSTTTRSCAESAPPT